VWVHERPCLGQTMIQVMMTFHEWLKGPPPWKGTW
jgi:hypothetical protein